jgi:hypothetical protein
MYSILAMRMIHDAGITQVIATADHNSPRRLRNIERHAGGHSKAAVGAV